ncbi:MAG: sigma-70 family RNA polymerase sigma factor [Planctomycetota bacterium]|nr:sigma-70 family RNA polymerase sigma factor [Planctomycetota bacterium]
MTTALTPDELLSEAQAGSTSHLGQLLELYRRYLGLLARIEIGRQLQAKLDASDLVQDALLEAHRNFPKFRGASEQQFVGWLRQIMAASLANLLRRYLGTQGRDVRLERELAARLDQSSRLLDRGLIDPLSSPSQQAVHREQAVLLANALEQLPEDYRDVLVLRHLEGLSFPEISRRMNRSLDSVEKLWVRGLARLRQVMGGAS